MTEKYKQISEGLTYDDVLVVPDYSEVLPSTVGVTTNFTKNIKLNIPIVSAAMDTVTEAGMAIAIAQEGGIGVLHKNMSIENQVNEVRKVKRSESGMILDPITLLVEAKVGDAMNIMQEFKIGGIPIINKKNELVGIVTNRDLRFEKDLSLPIKQIMTTDNIITTEIADLENAEHILQENKIEKLPVVNKNNELVGLITFKDIIKNRMRPNACKDKYGRLRVVAAVGVTTDVFERIAALVKVSVDAIIIDTAHGHSKGVIDLLKKIKSDYPKLDVVVGNIATAKAAKDLIDAGADAIKVGIGPGSICTTRIIAGIGVPQLTALLDVNEVAKKNNIPVIADGGIRYSGDIVKALVAGSSAVMLGSLIAGVEEAPGETIIFEGRKFKTFRGMGSVDAMQDGSKDRYFQTTENDPKKLVPEGIVGRVAYKGTLSEVIHQMIGGLRAGMGYCGAKNITDLAKARFIKITASGVTESHPHDVTITREAPNYSRK
ncbi:MAG TPA: IMP dehydrogenase [Flavobacteriales bacterium]|jgi:IMP dehydrogenase|nr:IMP dehydrogenase [Flavobacteriales bacterium]|tara:strand:+ start:19093 stop:20559 length:1467 start_codon:yes stop_codon:yes gene_type:complete